MLAKKVGPLVTKLSRLPFTCTHGSIVVQTFPTKHLPYGFTECLGVDGLQKVDFIFTLLLSDLLLSPSSILRCSNCSPIAQGRGRVLCAGCLKDQANISHVVQQNIMR